jgi:hypothetical protein
MQLKPMTGISDQDHIFYPHVTDIQFNCRRSVNEMMLKIKEHRTKNIVNYIPEIIRSLDQRINSLYQKKNQKSDITFLISVSIYGKMTIEKWE